MFVNIEKIFLNLDQSSLAILSWKKITKKNFLKFLNVNDDSKFFRMFKKIIFILILLTSGLNSLDLKKIIGGEKAELGDIPYQVLIYTLVETHKSRKVQKIT